MTRSDVRHRVHDDRGRRPARISCYHSVKWYILGRFKDSIFNVISAAIERHPHA